MTIAEIRRFRATLRRFERVTHAQLKSCCAHVTLAQCLVLLEIDESGRLTMGELAARLRLDASTLSRTIEGLVQRQLVERLREDQDRRLVRIRLTSEGRNPSAGRSTRSTTGTTSGSSRRSPKSRRGAVIKNFETLVQAFLDCEIDAMSGVRLRLAGVE